VVDRIGQLCPHFGVSPIILRKAVSVPKSQWRISPVTNQAVRLRKKFILKA